MAVAVVVKRCEVPLLTMSVRTRVLIWTPSVVAGKRMKKKTSMLFGVNERAIPGMICTMILLRVGAASIKIKRNHVSLGRAYQVWMWLRICL